MATHSIILTSDEIAKYRQQFSGLSDANQALDADKALNVIEECEGNLEDATLLLIMRETGKQPDRAINLNEIANRCRAVICQKRTDNILELFKVVAPFLALQPEFLLASLAVPVIIYIVKVFGIQRFCENG